jgi:hypothetical protein
LRSSIPARLLLPDARGGPEAEEFPDPREFGLLGGARTAGIEVVAHFRSIGGRQPAVDQVLDLLSRFPAFHLLTFPGTP